MFSKKEYQRKCQEEQEANGRVFQDFLETFQTEVNTVKTKTWVKAGSFDAGTGREDPTEKGTLYEPKPLITGHQDQNAALKNALECARIIKDKKNERVPTRKPTTNLEALKEEIKQRHIERLKVKETPPTVSNPQAEQDILDPNSTNLYIGNIHPKLTESDLIQMFGAYGPLASVKIMWPRGEENNRNSHCGFVAYMSRKDAERAYEDTRTTDIKVSWGKFVDVPQFPIYVPPALQSLTQPPPSSGLPFNAQPLSPRDKSLRNSTVKVSIPTDKKLIAVIHRVIEFVIREGPLFEAMIMNRELKNPAFKFLFENNSAAHTYYRWKLYSIMNGEAVKTWSTQPFRMFTGGSVWTPPTSLDYSKGMPEHLLERNKCTKQPRLSETQCKRFVNFLRELSTKRLKIGESMIFCLNHADCYVEITEYVAQSLCNTSTNPLKKLARLFLVSDVLSNCASKTPSKSQNFRWQFEQHLPEIFRQLHRTQKQLRFSCDREAYKTRVSKVLREWELSKIYPDEFLNKLEGLFLGQTANKQDFPTADSESEISDTPLEEEAEELVPLKDCKPPAAPAHPGFVPSRWETVDPEEVEAQAMSTKKYYHMEMQRKNEEASATSRGKLNDKTRKRLREVELLVMQLQDELESGRKKVKKGSTLDAELERYRAKLMERITEKSDSSNSASSQSDREDDARDERRERRRSGSRTRNSCKKTRCEKRRRRCKY